MTLVPAPAHMVISSAGWAADESILIQVIRWSSSLWSYRMLSANQIRE
jgi:hypothetical protein